MSWFDPGKIVGAVLIAAFITAVVNLLGNMLVQPGMVAATAPAEPPPAEKSADPPKPAGPEPIAARLKSADAAKGKAVARKCSGCHALKKGGANKVGPMLWDIVNADKAVRPGFRYSKALKQAGGEWDYEALDRFIFSPKDAVPGTKMAIAGIKKARDRANLIAYLRSLSDRPAPLP